MPTIYCIDDILQFQQFLLNLGQTFCHKINANGLDFSQLLLKICIEITNYNKHFNSGFLYKNLVYSMKKWKRGKAPTSHFHKVVT